MKHLFIKYGLHVSSRDMKLLSIQTAPIFRAMDKLLSTLNTQLSKAEKEMEADNVNQAKADYFYWLEDKRDTVKVMIDEFKEYAND